MDRQTNMISLLTSFIESFDERMNAYRLIVVVVFFLQRECRSEGQTFELSRSISTEFLQSSRTPLKQSKETVETTRELCLDEFRQHQHLSSRRSSLSSVCRDYCRDTSDCDIDRERSACVPQSWPSKLLKFVQKVNRMCYIRVTKVLRYAEAEQLCHQYGLQPAIIDTIELLEKLRALNMFNTTCKGQCPTAKGYYIGLRRINFVNKSSVWQWSNNKTWVETQFQCDDDLQLLYPKASLLCYVGNDGQKKITVWNPNEPNNYGLNENCVEILTNTERDSSSGQVGQLNDIPCYKPLLGVLCQMEDTKPVNWTHFQSFATRVGFDETSELLANFQGSIAPNLDAMNEVTKALENLLSLPSFTINQATNVFDVVNRLVDVTNQIEIDDDQLKPVTNKVLNFLNRFPVKIETNVDDVVSFDYENLNLTVVTIPIGESTDDWFVIPSMIDNEDRFVRMEINRRVLQTLFSSGNETYRMIETIFSNFHLFPSNNQTNLATPLAFQIGILTNLKANEDFIRFEIRLSSTLNQSVGNISCAYWSFERNEGSWVIDQGCRLINQTDEFVQCSCNHLTHFALIMLPDLDRLSDIEELLLSFVTYVGIGFSIIGLLFTLITYVLFRRVHNNALHRSLIMLCVAILIVNCLFIPFSLIQSSSSRFLCHCLGFFFHYFSLSSFVWMFIMAFVQYLKFVRIFNSHISHFFWKTSLIGWIFPLICPATVMIFDGSRAYIGDQRCWMRNSFLFYSTFLFPVGLIVVGNLILFILILRSIWQHNPSIVHSQKKYSKLQFSATLCCFVSIGCTWVFGLVIFIWPNLVHQFLFCLFNSSQGFLIFLFHVYLSKAKRELWQTFLLNRSQTVTISNPTTDQMTTSPPSSGTNTNLIQIPRPVTIRFTPPPSNVEIVIPLHDRPYYSILPPSSYRRHFYT